MVQANADGRPRSRRARQSEEQAPLVESYLSSSGSTSYQGICPWVPLGGLVLWPHTLALLWGAAQGLAAGLVSGCAEAGCGSQLRWREAG